VNKQKNIFLTILRRQSISHPSRIVQLKHGLSKPDSSGESLPVGLVRRDTAGLSAEFRGCVGEDSGHEEGKDRVLRFALLDRTKEHRGHDGDERRENEERDAEIDEGPRSPGVRAAERQDDVGQELEVVHALDEVRPGGSSRA
jgi:hypothetical protein